MVTEHNYTKNLEQATELIFNLPATEAKYYLYILITAIKKQNNVFTRTFLMELLCFLDIFTQLHQTQNLNPVNERDELKRLFSAFNRLQTTSGNTSLLTIVTRAALNFIGIVVAFILIPPGLLIGSIAGFIRGFWTSNPLSGCLSGLFLGMVLGGTLGFRFLKQLLKNELMRQISFALNGLESCLEHFEQELLLPVKMNQSIRPFSAYLAEVESELAALFSDQNEFNAFLNEPFSYEISSFHASFIGQPILHGYVGHHVYIKIVIKEKEYLIELSPTASDTTEEPAQNEIRTVNGKKILEMLAYHRKLQETNSCSPVYIMIKLKPGDRDCLSYANMVLLGTNQKGVELQRFADMAPVGQIIGVAIETLSPFKPTFFQAKKTRMHCEESNSESSCSNRF